METETGLLLHTNTRNSGHDFPCFVVFEKVFKTLSDIFINVLCNQILRVIGFSHRTDHVYHIY
jgi:hypothetical protein